MFALLLIGRFFSHYTEEDGPQRIVTEATEDPDLEDIHASKKELTVPLSIERRAGLAAHKLLSGQRVDHPYDDYTAGHVTVLIATPHQLGFRVHGNGSISFFAVLQRAKKFGLIPCNESKILTACCDREFLHEFDSGPVYSSGITMAEESSRVFVYAIVRKLEGYSLQMHDMGEEPVLGAHDHVIFEFRQ